MIEVSEYKISLDIDLAKIPEGLDEIERILAEKVIEPFEKVISRFSDVSRKVADSNIAEVPEINAFSITGIITFITTVVGLILAIDEFKDRFEKNIKEPKSLLGKLEAIEQQARLARREADKTLEEIEAHGESPNSLGSLGLPLDKKFIQDRIDLLEAFIEKIEKFEKLVPIEATTGALQAGIPEQPKPVDVPNMFGPQDIILESDPVKVFQQELNEILDLGNKLLEQRSQIFPALNNATAMASDTISDAINPLQAHKDALEANKNSSIELAKKGFSPLILETDNLSSTLEGAEGDIVQAGEKMDSLNVNMEDAGEKAEMLEKAVAGGAVNLKGYGDAAKTAAEGGLTQLEDKVEGVNNAASNVDLGTAKEQIEEVEEGLNQTSETGRLALEELGLLASNVAAAINDTFSELIFRAFKGDFDNISDLWKSMLNSMLRSFANFAATILTNPIQVTLQSIFTGSGQQSTDGGGTGFKGLVDNLNIFSGVGDLFKEGGTLGFVGDLFREGGALAGIGKLFAEGGALSFISSAIPYVGAAISAASFIVPLVVGLFKKTPRLDIDFDTVQTELGDRAATVEEFLDEDFFKDNIARISVKRSAGLGVGGDDKIKEKVQDEDYEYRLAA